VIRAELDVDETRRVVISDEFAYASRGYWQSGFHTWQPKSTFEQSSANTTHNHSDLAARIQTMKRREAIFALADPDAHDVMYWLFSPDHITGRPEAHDLRSWVDNARASGNIPPTRPVVVTMPIEHDMNGDPQVHTNNAVFLQSPEEDLLLSSVSSAVKEMRETMRLIEQFTNN
jgi:hypothetical protein